MPNNQGGYGGYRRPDKEDRARRVRTGGQEPRREAPPLSPQDFEESEWVKPPAAPKPEPPRPAPLRSRFTEGAGAGSLQSRLAGSGHPPGPQKPPARPAGVPRPQPAPQSPLQARAAARRARARRRQQRRLWATATVAGILLLSGVITLLLPKSAKTDPTNTVPMDDKPAVGGQLVAPIPYAGGGTGSVQVLDWGTVGPVRQTGEEAYTLTPPPEAETAVPAFGRVTTEWFADAAFLGDSLTAGFTEYDIDVGGALVCGYEGISPNTIVNRATVNHPDRGEEIALDVLSEAQPAKLYVLIGTNALAGTGNDEGFLNYYARMLDELRAALPQTSIFVQSVLPVRPEALEKAPGLTTERLTAMNDKIRGMCADRGCYFLDLNAEFRDESGALNADYAESDGIHLTVSGYAKWVSFLCTHIPYDKDNPYQQGSTYYLDDSVKSLLNDLP